MEKEFVPYEQALALKELGFDEICFLEVLCTGHLYFCNGDYAMYETKKGKYKNIKYKYDTPKEHVRIKVPTFSQAFRWFREKYGYFTSPTESDDDISKKYDWLISKNLGESKMFIQFIGYRDSYEEAELECLKKLIEIVKEKQNG
jgi:hypothetical protein